MPSVKVIQSVAHGRFHLHEGETRDDLAQADINALKELGFVADHTLETPPAEDSLDDLVGGEKMEDTPKNKMAPAPANKKAR